MFIKIIKLKLLLFLAITSHSIYSQIEIPLITRYEGKSPIYPATEEEKIEAAYISEKINLAYSENFSKENEQLIQLIESDTVLTDFGRKNCILRLIYNLVNIVIFDDTCIYNHSLTTEFYTQEANETNSMTIDQVILNNSSKIISGGNYISQLYEKAIDLSKNSEERNYFKKERLKYFYFSSLLFFVHQYDFQKDFQDEMMDFNHRYEYFDSNKFEDAELIGSTFYKTNWNDFNSTYYDPNISYLGLNIGGTGMYGKDLWIGFESSIDASAHHNPFVFFKSIDNKFNFRNSFLGLSYMKNVSNGNFDFAFYPFNLRNNNFINLSPVQFGFQGGDDFNNGLKWFYRPEIGVTIGIFSFTYGYNLLFDKNYRSLSEKNVFNFKVSYPLVKLVDLYVH
jgi:hypothetical protein